MSPLSLGVLGVGQLAAGLVHSVPLAAVGLLAYGALVAWDLVRTADPAPKLRAPEPPLLPDPASIRDPAVAAALRSILRTRVERSKAIALTPDAIRGPVQSALGAVDDLERHTSALVERAEALSAWLGSQDAGRLESELAALDERIRRTADPEAKDDYTRAREAKASQVQAVSDIGASRERILANLARIGATLEGLPPQLVRLRALDEAALDELGGELGGQLAALNGEMKLFESTLLSLSTDAPWSPPARRPGVSA